MALWNPRIHGCCEKKNGWGERDPSGRVSRSWRAIVAWKRKTTKRMVANSVLDLKTLNVDPDPEFLPKFGSGSRVMLTI